MKRKEEVKKAIKEMSCEEKLSLMENKNKRLEKELTEMYRVQQCLVAAGLISESKIKEAEDLVRQFNE